MRRLLFMTVLALLLAISAAGRLSAQEQADTAGLELGPLHVTRPNVPARALLYLISDEAGWTPDLAKVAADLASKAVATIGLSLPELRQAQNARDGDCLYIAGDLEAMSHRLQRELATDHYLTPIVAGVGAGATLAYAILAQAPQTMLDGVVALDPAATLDTPRPLCAGAPVGGEAGHFTYGRFDQLPGWWLVGIRAGHPDPVPWADDMPAGEKRALPGDLATGPALLQLLGPTLDEITRPDDSALSDLPITELPAASPGPLLAIILSGDGGWRDIDKQIGGWLADHGVATIGIDSMRYFWTAKTPEAVAHDLSRIAKHYLAAWNRKAVILVGYSFGADVLPAALAQAGPSLSAEVVQVSLLALSHTADFEFHVTGWLGATSADARPVTPDLLRLDPKLVQCFYGAEDSANSPCAEQLPGSLELVRTEGGHHFDGDYEGLARRIMDGATRRLTARP